MGKKLAVQPYQQALALWILVSLINYWTGFPVEWVFMATLTLTIFVQAYELGIFVFLMLVTVIFLTDALVYGFIPYEFTTLNASFVVHTFLVYGMHGCGLAFDLPNLKGWLIVLAMIVLRFTVWNPWVNKPPPAFMSPIAAHCTVTGTYYLLWKVVFLGYKNFDQVSYMFGIVTPDEPVVVVEEITESALRVHWTAEPVHGAELEGHFIEVNGTIIGQSAPEENSMLITGLNPGTQHRLRIWAFAGARIKTPSKAVWVRTLDRSPPAETTEEAVPTKPEADMHDISEADAILKEEREVEEQIERIRAEVRTLRRQRLDLESNMIDAELQYQREEKDVQDEILRIRTQKKEGEGPRAQQRVQVKQLEDLKRETDAARLKMEKKLNQEVDARDKAIDLLNKRKRGLERYQKELEKIEDDSSAARTSYEKNSEELESTIRQLKIEIEARKEKISQQQAFIASSRGKLADRERELESLQANSQANIHWAEEPRAASRHADLSWGDIYAHLQEEHQLIQADLREENRAKMQLLQQLAEAKRNSEHKHGIGDVRRGESYKSRRISSVESPIAGTPESIWNHPPRPPPPPGFDIRPGSSSPAIGSVPGSIAPPSRSRTPNLVGPSNYLENGSYEAHPLLGFGSSPGSHNLGAFTGAYSPSTLPITIRRTASPSPLVPLPPPISTDPSSLSLFQHGPVTTLVTNPVESDPFGFGEAVELSRTSSAGAGRMDSKWDGGGSHKRAMSAGVVVGGAGVVFADGWVDLGVSPARKGSE